MWDCQTHVSKFIDERVQIGTIQSPKSPFIKILNRDGLEDCACECYSVIRAEPTFGEYEFSQGTICKASDIV